MAKNDLKEYFLILGLEEQRISAAVARLFGDEITILGTGESEWSNKENTAEAADIAISTAEKNLEESVLLEKVIFGIPINYLENDTIKPEFLTTLKTIAKELDLKPSGFIEYPQAISYYIESKESSSPTLLLLIIGHVEITVSLIRVGRVEKNLSIVRSSSFPDDINQIVNLFKDEILPSRILLYDQTRKANSEQLREELLKFSWHKHSSFLHTPKIETLPENIGTLALVEAAGGSMLRTIQEEEKQKTESVQLPVEMPTEGENFGFVKHEEKEESTEPEILLPKEIDEDVYKKEKTPTRTATISSFLGNLPKPTFPKMNISLPHPKGKLFFILPLIALIILFFFLIFSFVWFYPMSDVHLIIYPLATSEHTQVHFTTDVNSSSEKNTVMATTVSTEANGEKTSATTGKSRIGEAAKGEITIYNKTLSAKTFPKGTIVTSDSLKFSLDSETLIASASDTGEGLTFGKTSSKVTAIEIGPEGNISGSHNFTFKDFPDSQYYGKNADKFSGGSSREISSVSKDDQDELQSLLTDELIKNAKQDLTQKTGINNKILDDSIETKVKSKKFSKEIGAESKDLALHLIVEISALSYKNSDIQSFLSTSSSIVPSGYTPDPTRTTVQMTGIRKDKKGDYLSDAAIISYYLPTIDTSAIKSKITGKSYDDIRKYLSSVQNIAGFEVVDIQSIPFLENKLPYRPENITIRIIPR